MSVSTTVSNLKINKLTKEQYEGIEEPSSTELYFVTDEKEASYESGKGISITPTLQTEVNITCSDPSLTVTSSYDDTESSPGIITYEFEYKELDGSRYSGGSKSEVYSSYYILNGYLYRGEYASSSTMISVDENDNWSFIAGDVGDGAYGINNGKLYQIRSMTATLVDNSTAWTFVNAGHAPSTPYSYGIKNGQLYLIQDTTVTLLNSDTDWTYISGEYRIDTSYVSNSYCYGLKGGKLYAIQGTTLVQIGSDTTWTAVSGECYKFIVSYSETYLYHAYGINNGKLYEIHNTDIVQVGESNTWSVVTGSSHHLSSSNYRYAFGINNGKLFALTGGEAVQVGESTTWSDVKGYSIAGSYYETVGINGGNLQVINGNLQVKALGSNIGYLILSNPGGNSTARVFVERDGKLYCFWDFQSATTGAMSLGLLGSIDSSRGWFLNNEVVNLSDYSLEVAGTPMIGDTISLSYTTDYLPNVYTISLSGGM